MMKRRLLAVLLSLIMLFSLSACGDTTTGSGNKGDEPSAAEQPSEERPAAEAEPAAAHVSRLKAAASKQELVLPDDFLPYSGFRRRNFAEAHESLYCRAIVMQNDETTVAMLTYEIGDVGGVTLDHWMETLEAETGIPRECIFFHAEHVHSAPYAGSDCEENVVDVEKSEQFKEICLNAAIAAVRECLENLEPATVNIGTSQCYVNVNRDYPYRGSTGDDSAIKSAYITWMNPEGYSDHTVTVLEFNSVEDGRPIALWTNYAVHSEVMFHVFQYADDKMILCSDIAGHASMYVEDAFEACGEDIVCMYTMGAAGDQMPQSIGVYYTFDAEGNATEHSMTADGALEVMQAQANSLGEAILAAYWNMDAENAVSELELYSVQDMLSVPGKLKDEDRGDYHGPTTIPTADGWEYDLNADPVDLEIGLIKIGGFAIGTVGTEIAAQIGTDIQTALKEGGASGAMVVSVCNGQHAYLTTEEGYDAATFEATASLMAPGSDALVIEGIASLQR